MTLLNIPESYITSKSDDKITYEFGLAVFKSDNKLKFEINGLATSWMDSNDSFVKKISFENINRCFRAQHLRKEIEIKNILDEGKRLFESEKYSKAIKCFDEVIFYDENYAEALLLKSHALFSQGHFIKSLRYYKKTIKADASLKDGQYHKLLLSRSFEERDNLPKIKFHIYTGDEYFARGDFKRAVESYDRALANPSQFKSKILYKLLNKKGTALFRLKEFGNALTCFEKSLKLNPNDYACYMAGFSSYCLNLPFENCFYEPLKIAKNLRLYQALILNDARRFEESIKCVDDLLSVHFNADRIYMVALSCKISSMESLGMDASSQKDLLMRL